MLLLDEATSALDQSTEATLMQSIREISRTCCVVMVAHRMSTVQTCDRIDVMEGGRLRAEGTHAELLASDDVYAALVRSTDGADAAEVTA